MFKSPTVALVAAVAMVVVSCNVASEVVKVDVTLTSAGGDFTFGDVTVHIPANAVITTHQVTIGAASGAPASNRLVGVPVSVTLSPPDSLLQPATVEVRYSSLNVPSRIPKGTIRAHRAVGGKWVSLGGTNSTGTSVVTAQTSGFSDFALLGLRAETVQSQSPTSQTATPSTNVASPPSVRVLDSAGAVLPGVPVAFAVTAGGGSIQPASVTSNAQGIATATSWTAGPGANNTNTATATAADLSPLSFTATAGSGGGGGPLGWFSDWRNGIGQGSTAIHDGGKWGSDQGIGLSTQFAIVAATGLGFPTDNVARVTYDAQAKNFQLVSEIPSSAATVPAVGQYWYMRYYYRTAVAAGQDLGEAHWLQTHDIASWEFKHTGGGQFRIVLDASGNVLAFDDSQFLVDLSVNTTYRVEMQIQRLSASTGKMQIRVYDTNNALIHGNSDFHTFNGPGDTMAGRNPTMPLNNNSFINFDMGNNDPNRSGVGNVYVGAFATRVSNSASDWIGPYTTGG